VDAVLERKLPAQTRSCGCTYFSKVETANPTVGELQAIYRMKEVVSPPFPVAEAGDASALIASHGATLQEASSRFREAKKRVLNTISRGK
jgi:hypothetical protein